jgi:hypothetical protein
MPSKRPFDRDRVEQVAFDKFNSLGRRRGAIFPAYQSPDRRAALPKLFHDLRAYLAGSANY